MIRSVRIGGVSLQYTLIQSVRKSITIRMYPGRDVRVCAPTAMPLREIDAFVRKNGDEILRKCAELDEKIVTASKKLMDGDAFVTIEGIKRRITLHKGAFDYRLHDDSIEVWVDADDAHACVKRALIDLSLQRFKATLAIYAPRIGVSYGRVTIREQKTRWGSCSSKDNLNFNWRLIMAPKDALTYVVIHELCHLIEFNHSARFWSLVQAQMPDYKVWVDYLKRHGSELVF